MSEAAQTSEDVPTVADAREEYLNLYDAAMIGMLQSAKDGRPTGDFKCRIDHEFVKNYDRVLELERDMGILVEEFARMKASNNMTMRALVYQAGGYVALRKETLEEVPHIILHAVETKEGQLVMRTARHHGTEQ